MGNFGAPVAVVVVAVCQSPTVWLLSSSSSSIPPRRRRRLSCSVMMRCKSGPIRASLSGSRGVGGEEKPKEEEERMSDDDDGDCGWMIQRFQKNHTKSPFPATAGCLFVQRTDGRTDRLLNSRSMHRVRFWGIIIFKLYLLTSSRQSKQIIEHYQLAQKCAEVNNIGHVCIVLLSYTRDRLRLLRLPLAASCSSVHGDDHRVFT